MLECNVLLGKIGSWHSFGYQFDTHHPHNSGQSEKHLSWHWREEHDKSSRISPGLQILEIPIWSSIHGTCCSMSHPWLWTAKAWKPSGRTVAMGRCTLGEWMACVKWRLHGIHRNAMTQGFQAEHCILMTWSMFITSPGSPFNVVANLYL